MPAGSLPAAVLYQNERGRNHMKEKNLERLYKLLERAEREHDTETAAALRWDIYELERG